MEQIVGKQSIQFQQAAHILSGAAIVGKKEGDGPLGKYFDKIGEEEGLFGCTSWEVICKRKQYLWRLKKPVLKSGSFV